MSHDKYQRVMARISMSYIHTCTHTNSHILTLRVVEQGHSRISLTCMHPCVPAQASCMCMCVCTCVSTCVAVWRSVLQCVLVCCSQCVAVCLQCVAIVEPMCPGASILYAYVCMHGCCSVLQCVAVCCSVLQCVAMCCNEL